jgi:hypothetical protein
MEAYAGRQFVGMDLHRRRSVLVRMTAAGEVLERVRIVNDTWCCTACRCTTTSPRSSTRSWFV